MKDIKSICLNMIVKDESHIIKKTLENLCSYINFNYWIICDTGSIDNTREIIIDFFKERNIPGELFNHTWQDFGNNRTLALLEAYNKSDYILIFDADDSINGNFILPDLLKADKYNFIFGNITKYRRVLLINNIKHWKFNVFLHEYLVNIDPIDKCENIEGDYYINSGRTGNRNNNKNKYYDDAIVLENAIKNIKSEDIHLISRYTFYCAQSFYDSNNYNESLIYYKKVLELNTWDQEKYISALQIGDIYKSQNNMEEALYYWYKAIDYDKERLESIINIMEYYLNKKYHFAVNCLYMKIKDYKINDESSKLFLNTSRYDDIDFYNSISACNVSEWLSGYYSCKKLLLKNKYVKTTIYNLRCYIYNIKFDTDKNTLLKKLLELFEEIYNDNSELVIHTWNMIPTYFKEYFNEYSKEYNCVEKYTEYRSLKKNKNKIKTCNSKKILIYTGFNSFLWNDTYIENNSIGGSEKAVAYLSRYFSKDYEIIISGDVIDEHKDNVRWINRFKLQYVLDNEEFHTIIISRYVSFLLLYPNFKCFQLYLMAHDVCFINNINNSKIQTDTIIQDWSNEIDKVIVLTNWHKSNILSIYPILKDKIYIINNGILPNKFPSVKKIKNKFVWTSVSNRGLKTLLNLWSDILIKIPDATLDISSYKNFPDDKDDNYMLEIINKYKSITHHGKLDTNKLYKLLSYSEYWLYTTNFNETSCITGMEMLMSEVVCLYYPIAGLTDTIGEYGIQVQRGNEIDTIINLSEERKNELRYNGKKYAINCSWEKRAESWINLIKNTNTCSFENKCNVKKNINKIKVINLLRRKDRRNSSIENFKRVNITNYEFIEAVDGKTLTPNAELISLFKGNCFGNRQGVIGCALSHYNLWKKLLESDFEYFIIMEDDFTIVESFKEEIEKINFEKYETLFLGHHIHPKTPEKVKYIYRNSNKNEYINITIDRLKIDYFGGGTHCYSINKNGAKKILDYINKNGIIREIDWIFNIPKLECFETCPHISFAESNEIYGKEIDSDIQNIYDSIDLN